MKSSWCFILFLLCPLQVAPRTVSHEDIRDAIISMVHLVQSTTQKLERHEMRERQLGDQLKKALGGLDGRERAQDSAIASIAAILNRIDGRIKNIELQIQQQDERQKGSYTIDTVPLQSWMSNVEVMLNKQTPSTEVIVSKDQLQKTESLLNSKIDSLTAAVERLEVQSIQSREMLESTVELKNLHNNIEKQFVVQEKWHQSIVSLLEDLQRSSLVAESINPHTDNFTKEELAKIRYDLEYISSDKLMNIDVKIQEVMRVSKELPDFSKKIKELRDSIDGYFIGLRNSQSELTKDVKSLTKVEQVVIQTADNVLETRRRIEYGVQEILLGVSEVVKYETMELNDTINNRFSDISQTILENQNGALLNLSTKIETEVSQVWRQIGVMYKQLTESTVALDKLQKQTEKYVNGSLSTMDSMDGRVVEITGRVSDVKENLNYLMGKLLLVTQEFNQTKGDLALAFENLRNTFKSVRKEVKDLGPGPNPIPEQEGNDV